MNLLSQRFVIRRATLADLQVIQDLNHELFVSDNALHGDMNVNWPYESTGESYFKACIVDEDKLSVLAEDNGKIVGYLNGVIKKPHSAYIGIRAELDNMCVTKDYRSQGIGTTLINEFKQWAKRNRVDKITVAATAQNTKAIRFYLQNGFGEYELKLIQDI